MTVVVNESFAHGLATELAGQVVGMSGAVFDEYDFAMFLAKHFEGAKIVWTEDGVGVAWNNCFLKTIVRKIRCPHQVRHVDQTYCINDVAIPNIGRSDENTLGAMVLGIWNARITDVRKKFSTTRTVVLAKGEDLSTVSVFEDEALKFLPEEYEWEWNQKGNLEGYLKGTDVKKFTWQPHGSQFTVTTNVPEQRLKPSKGRMCAIGQGRSSARAITK